jgi:hypothetical protein
VNDDIAENGACRDGAPTVGRRTAVSLVVEPEYIGFDGVVAVRGDAVCFASAPVVVVA